MEKNSKEQFLKKIEQHNKNIPKSIFQTKPQEYLVKYETFGISNQNINGQFSVIGKDEILYYCSSMLIIKSIDKNTSLYLYKEGRLKNVTAICCTTKQLEDESFIIAAGEQSFVDNQKTCITVITISGKKEDWKVIPTQHKGRIQYLQFNHSRTKLGCISISSDQIYFTLYNIEKASIVVNSTFKSNDIKRFTLDINSQKSMYLYGDGLLKIYEFNTNEKCLKDLGTTLLTKENKETKFIDHIWLPGNTSKQSYSLILISNTKIFVIKNQNILKTVLVDIEKTKIKSWNSLKLQYTRDPEEERQTIDPQQIRLTEKFQLKCLIKEERKKSDDSPLIIGASNGLIIFYDLPTGEFSSYQILSNQQMVSLSSNSNRTIIASVSKDYYDKNLCFNLIRPEMLDTDDAPFRCLFGEGHHFNTVLSLSVAAGRQLFATCSSDKSIRVWNYSTKQSITFGSYKQTPISATIHPSGFWIAIAFSNQIDIYSILSNSLYLLKSVRNLDEVRSIQFSNKGHFLISNETSCLKLYDPYTLRVVSIYEMDDGRTSLLSYAINYDDTRMVAVFQNGNVYNWQIQEGDNELPMKPCHVESLGYQHMIIDENYFIGSNGSKYLSLYKNNGTALINEFPIIDCTVTSMYLSKQLSVLFIGTSSGTIRLYSWPINESACCYQMIENSLSYNKVRLMLPNCYEVVVHNSSVTALGLSEDCRYIFGGLDNGGVVMLEVKGLRTEEQRNEKNKEWLIETKEERRKIKQATTNIFLICDSKMKEKNEQLRRMELELEKMEEGIEKQKIGRQKHLQRLITEKLDEYSNVIVKEKMTQDKTLLAQKREISKLESAYISTKNLFQNNTNTNIATYERGHNYQLKRRENLKEQIEGLKKQHIIRLDGLLGKHKIKLNQIKEHYKGLGNKVQQEYKGILSEAQQKFNLKEINAQEDEVELSSNEEKIIHLKKVIEELKQTHLILEEENQKNQVEDQMIQTEFSNMFDNHNNCRLKNIKLRQEILKTEHQLNERIGIVRNKELSYKEASECQMTLENYKSVIDNRISELQNKKKQIFEKTKQKQSELEVLFNELISSTDTNQKKKFEIKKHESYKQNLEENVRRSEIQIFFGIKRLKSYQEFIEDIISSKEPKNKIHAKIHNFLQNPLPEDLQMVGYLEKTSITHKDMKEIYKLKEEKGNQQNNKLEDQGKVLTKKFNLMKFTCKKMKDTHEANITYTLKQNQKLIEECNLLRYENQCYQKEIRKAQKFINLTIDQQKKLTSQRRNSQKLKDVEKRLKDNEESLKQQTFQLYQIREFISAIKKQKQF